MSRGGETLPLFYQGGAEHEMPSNVIDFGDAKKKIEKLEEQRRRNCERAFRANISSIADSIIQTSRIFHVSVDRVLDEVADVLISEDE